MRLKEGAGGRSTAELACDGAMGGAGIMGGWGIPLRRGAAVLSGTVERLMFEIPYPPGCMGSRADMLLKAEPSRDVGILILGAVPSVLLGATSAGPGISGTTVDGRLDVELLRSEACGLCPEELASDGYWLPPEELSALPPLDK